MQKSNRRFWIRKSALVLWLLPLGLVLPCHANDSAFSGVSGTPKPLKGEHRSILMESEKVSIVANGSTYDTVVDFVFRNDGKATSVQMGFPESSYGDVEASKKTTFLSFATWVDGQKVTAKRVVISQQEPEVEAFWIKTVNFQAGETKKIRVAYRSPMGGTTTWGVHNALTYDFTGKNWKGSVKRSDLEVKITKPGLWIGYPLFDNKALPMTQQTTPQSTVFRKTWRNWQAQGYFMFGLTPAVPFWLMDREYVNVDYLKGASTFRVGPVPKELPSGAENPNAFQRDGVTYIELSRLAWRMSFFADDLEKYRGLKTKVQVDWKPETRTATMRVGASTLSFTPGKPVATGEPSPILLSGMYGSSLYVPLEAFAKKLGVAYEIDAPNRNYRLTRGTWTGQ